MVSVIIPALNEVANIESVVAFARRCPAVGEVIVVDDGSVDGTPEAATRAGARVITSSLLGKGASMDDGLQAARGDILVYLDGDLRGLNDHLIELLANPIRQDQADFVKARFSRSAGRVTALTARPLLQTFFPEIASFTQPLGGIIAVRRALLEKLPFETDYGVDLALLIDAHFLGARIAEVDIGHLEHDSQSLEALGQMAKQVVRALMHRAERHGRLSINQVVEIEEVERQSRAEFSLVTGRLAGAERLALFDMDGTLLRDRSVVVLAKQTGRYAALCEFLDRQDLSPADRTRAIARLLAGVPRAAFEEVARTMELSEGARETIVALRKEGYRVGIVSDSYRIITEIVRRRVFADFSIANLMRFRDGIASGDVTLSPIFEHPNGCPGHPICKGNVLLHLEEKLGIPSSRILSVGDSANDICLLRHSGTSIAFEPKTSEVAAAADFAIHADMQQVLAHLSVAK
jgi:HAD superfamily phosphoserine phosphatase-like hydrolase